MIGANVILNSLLPTEIINDEGEKEVVRMIRVGDTFYVDYELFEEIKKGV